MLIKYLQRNNDFKYNLPIPTNISPYHIIVILIIIILYNYQCILQSLQSCDYVEKINDYYHLEIFESINFDPKGFHIFDIVISTYFIYFLIIDKLFYLRKIILVLLLGLIFYALYTLMDNNLEMAYHLFMLFTLLPFLLNVIANNYLLDMPFSLFLNMHTYNYNKVNLFTNTKGQKEHHTSDAIYIDLFFLNGEGDNKELHSISKDYLRLIKFWYAYENYRFKVRYFFPILGLTLSVFIYLTSLFFIYDYNQTSSNPTSYLEHTSIMAIYLLILFFSINLHANNFLSSKFYMGNILNKLNQIYFDQYEYRQQLKLFLDKNFLVYIHDRNYDQELCVNTSKSFQKFISQETLDKEGRNNILTIFISFIMIFLIEVLVNVNEEELKKENTPNSTIQKQEKRC